MMKTVEFIIPEDAEANAGEVVEVPEADAAHFDEKGWSRVGGEKPKKSKEKPNPSNKQ